MKTFEYQTITITPKTEGFWGKKLNTEEIDKLLNEKGKQGWELVSVQTYSGFQGETTSFLYTFKREK